MMNHKEKVQELKAFIEREKSKNESQFNKYKDYFDKERFNRKVFSPTIPETKKNSKKNQNRPLNELVETVTVTDIHENISCSGLNLDLKRNLTHIELQHMIQSPKDAYLFCRFAKGNKHPDTIRFMALKYITDGLHALNKELKYLKLSLLVDMETTNWKQSSVFDSLSLKISNKKDKPFIGLSTRSSIITSESYGETAKDFKTDFFSVPNVLDYDKQYEQLYQNNVAGIYKQAIQYAHVERPFSKALSQGTLSLVKFFLTHSLSPRKQQTYKENIAHQHHRQIERHTTQLATIEAFEHKMAQIDEIGYENLIHMIHLDIDNIVEFLDTYMLKFSTKETLFGKQEKMAEQRIQATDYRYETENYIITPRKANS